MNSCTQTPFLVLVLIYNGRILWGRRPPHPRRSATGRLAEAEEIAGANEPETDSLWESLSWDRSFATSPPTKFDDAAIDESCLLDLLQHPSGRKPCRAHGTHGNREKAQVDRQVPAAPSTREFFLFLFFSVFLVDGTALANGPLSLLQLPIGYPIRRTFSRLTRHPQELKRTARVHNRWSSPRSFLCHTLTA